MAQINPGIIQNMKAGLNRSDCDALKMRQRNMALGFNQKILSAGFYQGKYFINEIFNMRSLVNHPERERLIDPAGITDQDAAQKSSRGYETACGTDYRKYRQATRGRHAVQQEAVFEILSLLHQSIGFLTIGFNQWRRPEADISFLESNVHGFHPLAHD